MEPLLQILIFDNFFLFFLSMQPLLVGHLAVAIHISPSNGPIEIIPSAKLVVSVLTMHCEPSIISIGPLLIKLLYLYVKGWLAYFWDE